MVMAGTCGVVGVTLGSGRTPREATDQCLRLAREVDVPNLAYRVDAGDRVDGDLAVAEGLAEAGASCAYTLSVATGGCRCDFEVGFRASASLRVLFDASHMGNMRVCSDTMLVVVDDFVSLFIGAHAVKSGGALDGGRLARLSAPGHQLLA